MLKRLLVTVRKCPLLKLLLFSHGFVITILVACYYNQGYKLWYAVLKVPVATDADGNRLYQTIARGPSLLLPWNLLPQDVFWLGLDILIFGTLAMWLAWRVVGDELRHQVAGREKAAADKLREAAEQSAAADHRMRQAEEWEGRLKGLESRVAGRESEATNRELEAQAHVEAKDAEVEKMSQALARLKEESGRAHQNNLPMSWDAHETVLPSGWRLVNKLHAVARVRTDRVKR